MKSFSRQLGDLLSFAGYKSNGKRLPCSVAYSPIKTHQNLTYRCDVALQLYEHYKKHGFKFSEKGVTPKAIAEEIALYVHDSKDYSIAIDSFGYFLVRPSEAYLERVQNQAEITGRIEHLQVVAADLVREKWRAEKKKFIFVPLEGFTLSALRIAYYLSVLKRKYLRFKEYHPAQVVQFMKARGLTEKDIRLLEQLRIVQSGMKYCKFLNQEPLLIDAEGRKPELLIESADEIVSGTVRHNYLPFLSDYESFISGKAQVLAFGDIFPDVHIDQIIPNRNEVLPKLLAHSLKFGINIPVVLKEEGQESYQPSELLETLRGRSDRERLLVLLDYLQEDRVVDLLALRETEVGRSDYLPFRVLFDQLALIV